MEYDRNQAEEYIRKAEEIMRGLRATAQGSTAMPERIGSHISSLLNYRVSRQPSNSSSETKPKPEPVTERFFCDDCQDQGMVRRDVPIEHKDFGRVFPCRCTYRRHTERYMERLAGPGAFDRYTFETFMAFPSGKVPAAHNTVMAKALKAAKAWATPEGKPWLLLEGINGCGKSHLALAGLREHGLAGRSKAYCHVTDYIALQKSAIGEEDKREQAQGAHNSVLEADVLVLDDYGAQKDTEWVVAQLEEMILHRYQRGMRTMITTNGLGDASPRVSSRVRDVEVCVAINLKGAVDVRAIPRS